MCCGEAVFLQDSPSHLLPHLNMAGSRAVPATARREGEVLGEVGSAPSCLYEQI